LDLSRLPSLRTLRTRWSHHLAGLETLRGLTHLNLRNIYGVESLDLSSLRNLRELSIGPAKGVRSLSLDGLRHLKFLELAVMSRLAEISGTGFYNSVTALRIPASHLIPRNFLSGFTKLEKVSIGTKSKITAKDFPRCKPKIFKVPI